MDADELFGKRADDPLQLLARQDLTPMSISELDMRVVALETEIARVKAHIRAVQQHKARADALFKK